MGKTIKLNGFTGMNNVKEKESLFVDKNGLVEPLVILDADVTSRNRVVKRDDITKTLSVSGAHSLWGNGRYMLYVHGGYLQYIDNETEAVQVASVMDPDGSRMSYTEVGKKVYMSSRWWNGIFDPDALSVSDWGIPLPGGPMLSAASGNLPAGVYRVCFTAENGTEISGNGPVAEIVLASEGGIAVSGRGAEETVWCTETNGHIFYKIGKTDVITAVNKVEPLLTFLCFPPPYLENLTYAFRRMWGTRDNRVYYSEPGHLERWRLGKAFFEFGSNPTMIAKVKEGLFIGCQTRTYFYAGTIPRKMKESDVGAGALAGSLTYANKLQELGDTISPTEKKHESVPIWVSEEGIVAGNQAGRLFSLSQGKVNFAPGKEGASLYRMKKGDLQILTSFHSGNVSESMGIGDDVTFEVFKNGKVI